MDIFIGMISTLVAFGAKYFADYLWIKSPRLHLKAKAISASKDNEKQRLISGCKIDVFNFSKNEAYNFELKSIVFQNADVVVDINSIRTTSRPITDQDHGEILFNCTRPFLENTPKTHTYLNDEDRQLIEVAIISCVYQNQLGKKYKKTIECQFTEQKREFFTF